MWQAIQKLVVQGSTVLLITQYLEEADHLANRIALIDHGQMITVRTPNALKQQVGGMQLRLEVTDLKQASQAQKIIQDILAVSVHVDERKLTALLSNTGMQSASKILNQFQTARIATNNFAIETPSLDDVFLKMTVGKN